MQSNQRWMIKRHRIFVHRIYAEQSVTLKAITSNAGRLSDLLSNVSYQMNQQLQICSIVKSSPDREINQTEAFLVINCTFGGQEKLIGTVGFDFRTQKPSSRSTQMRHQELLQGNGKISYKYLGSQVFDINSHDIDAEVQNRRQILVDRKVKERQERDAQYLQMAKLLQEKDEIIKNLQEKMGSLLRQTRNLQQNISREKDRFRKPSPQKLDKNKKSAFSINVNVQSNVHQIEYKKLLQENESLKEKVHQLQIKIEGLQDHIDNVQSELSDKKSIIQGRVFDIGQNKGRRNTRMTESRYEQKIERPASTINIGRHMNSERALSSSAVGSKGMAGDDDWERRRERRRQERYKQRSKQAEINQEYRRRQQTDRVRQQKQEQNNRQQPKSMTSIIRKQQVSQTNMAIDLSKASIGLSKVDQQRLRVTINRIEEQKMTLQQRLFSKKDQAESIYRELQRAKNREKKLDEQLQSYRSMINYYKSHGISLGEISQQQKEYLKNLARRSALGQLGDGYGDMASKQKQNLIQQKLRFQIVELKDQMQVLKNEYKITLEQKQMELLKRKLAEEAERKQKDLYVSKYRENNETLEGERMTAKQWYEKAVQLSDCQQKIKDLETHVMELTSKLSKETRDKNEQLTKVKKLNQMIQDRQIEWQRLKNIEANHDVIKVKSSNMERANQKFSENYKDLKKFAMKIEQLIGKKPRKTIAGKEDPKSQQEFNREVQKNLTEMQNQIKGAESTFFTEQIGMLANERDMYQQLYSKRIELEKARLKEQLADKADKNAIIAQREQELEDIKGDKIRQLNSRIERYQKLLENVKAKVPPADIADRVDELKTKLLSDGLISNQEFQSMKETIERLQKEVKSKEQELIFINKRSSPLVAGMGSTDDRVKARNLMMEDFLKTKEMLSKPFQDIKKINQDLMKQKNMLQIEVQNAKIRQQQLQNKLKDRDRQTERQVKKAQEDNNRKKDETNRIHTRLNEQINKLKADNKDYESSVRQLVDELKSVSASLENKQMAYGKLYDQKMNLEHRLVEYEQAETHLIEEVDKVKRDSSNNQAEFQRLFIERDQKFLRIQKLKQVQIQKLKDQVERTEDKLQRQILQGLKLREENDKYISAMAEYDQQIRIIKQAMKMQQQNHQMASQEATAEIAALQQQNDTLQSNLLELAQQINEKQLEVQQYKVKADYDARKVQSLEKMHKQFRQSEQNFYLEKSETQNLIEDQNISIKKLENQLQMIQSKISMLGEENDHYHDLNEELRAQIAQLKQTIRNAEDDLRESKRTEGDQLTTIMQQAKKKEARYQVIEKQLREQVQELITKVRNLEFQKMESADRVKDLQSQLEHQKSKSKNLDVGLGNVLRKSSRIVKKSSRMLDSPTQRSGASKAKSKRSYRGDEEAEANVSRPDSRQGKQASKQVSRQVSRASKISSDRRSSDMIIADLNTSNQMSKASKGHSRASKGEISHQGNSIIGRVSNGHHSLVKKQSKLNSVADVVALKEVNEQDDDNKGGLGLPEQKTKTMQLVRKGSNVEIEVSQCESEPVDERDSVREIAVPVLAHQDSLSLPDEEEGSFSQEQEQAEYEDVAHLLDEIQFLKQEKEGLLEKIQQQQQDLEGYKAQLLTWKQAAMDQKPSLREISHGFTSELNEKLRIEDLGLDEQQVPRHRPVFDASRSAVVEKPSKINFKRSNSRLERTEERQNQILLQEADEQIKMIQRQLDQERENVQKMIDVNKQIEEELQRVNTRLRQLEIQKAQIHEQTETLKSQMELKVEQATAENLSKQEIIADLHKNIGQFQSLINQKDTEMSELLAKLKQSETENEDKINGMKNLKKQFRRYQQQAQLEILRLKQGMQKLKKQIKLKNEDISTIGDQFIELEEKSNALKIELQHKESLIEGKQMEGGEMLKKYYDTVNLLKQQQLSKNELESKVAKLTSDLKEREQDIEVLSKESAISIKKYCIKIQALTEESQGLRKKLEDRDDQISRLKHQIMVYNDTVQEINKSKDSLSTELQRVEGQLKDIMHSYQGQFDQLSEDKRITQSQVHQYSETIRQKDSQINALNREVSSKAKQIKQLTNRLDQNSKALERFKIKSRNQVSDVYTQLQIKNDECQKLKSQCERDSQAYFSKQCEFIEQKQKYEAKIKDFKQKFLNYENQINELGEQLMEYSNRPPIQEWEQVNFQNQLFRNTVADLESNFRHQQQNSQEFIISNQFRKYRTSKEKEFHDLELEVQRYSNAVTQLEESNFYLKKQIEGLKHQIKHGNNEKNKLQSLLLELQSENQEMKLELDILKAKRAEDLGRMLDLSIN